jgi:type II secretory pathway pseudopilin PulG
MGLVLVMVAVLLFGVSVVWFGIPQVRFAAEQGKVSRVRAQLLAIVEAGEAYRAEYGSVPQGGATAVLSALRGSNEKERVFLELPAGMTNERGEVVDVWGTPVEIWTTGSQRVEARSAGPNRRFGDHDDLVSSQATTAGPRLRGSERR